jgi:uncharacterized protein
MREKLIFGITAGVNAIYRYFAAARKMEARTLASARTVRRDAPKVARNELCPCGSGRKFKHCCVAGQLFIDAFRQPDELWPSYAYGSG